MVQGPIRCDYDSCDELGTEPSFLLGSPIIFCPTHTPIILNQIDELEGVDEYFRAKIDYNPEDHWNFPNVHNDLDDLIAFTYLLRHYFYVVLNLTRLISDSWEGYNNLNRVCNSIISNISGIEEIWSRHQMGYWYGETSEDLRNVLEDTV